MLDVLSAFMAAMGPENLSSSICNHKSPCSSNVWLRSNFRQKIKAGNH